MNTYLITLSNGTQICIYGYNYKAAICSDSMYEELYIHNHIKSWKRIHNDDWIQADYIMISNPNKARKIAVEVYNKALPIETTKIP